MLKRFCNMFSESSPSLLGQHCNCSTAQRPVELTENILQNLFHKLPPQTVVAKSFSTAIRSASRPFLRGEERTRSLFSPLPWDRKGEPRPTLHPSLEGRTRGEGERANITR